jgi:RNA polymerase sigma-70 factor (ECF subfamily)
MRRATTFVAVAEPDQDRAWRPDDSLINKITVQNGMRRLEPAHREIVALIDISGFSYAEAADHLDIPVGTVMSRLSRARQTLLSSLQDSNVHVLPRPRTRSTQ